MFHTSDLKQYRFCPKLFWHKQHGLASNPIAFIQMPRSLGSVLIEYLDVENAFKGWRGMSPEEALQAYREHPWTFGLRFEANGLRVKVPGLYHDAEETRVYFTTLATRPKIEDSAYYAQVLWILAQNGIHPDKLFILYLDKDYVRQEPFDLKACFRLSDRFIKISGFDQGDALKQVLKKLQDPSEDLLQMRAVKDLEDYTVAYEDCPGKTKCEAFGLCFPEHANENEPESVPVNVRRLLNGEEPDEANPLNRAEYAQLLAYSGDGRFVDTNALGHWFKQFEGQTVTFVDFEWDTYGIPPFTGMKPFDVLPFQFSMHILGSETLEHREFLGQGDCREEFIQAFLEVLPKEGPILAYNAFGAEVLRLKHLGEQFPVYADALEAVIARFVDLANVFIGGVVYDTRMHGSYSLKSLIKAIDPELSYESLAISHGIQAVLHYRTMNDEEDDGVTRKALLSYCHMDTLAMVKVFEWLKTLL